MIAPDSSVLVAGFLPDHDFYDAADTALSKVRVDGCLIAHTMAETFAVLSGPAGVYQATPESVVAYLDALLGKSSPLQPRPDTYREAIELLSSNGRGGGAIYDALIALAARDAGAQLVSLDGRAAKIYDLCRVEARLLSA